MSADTPSPSASASASASATAGIRAACLDDAAEIARLCGELGYPATTRAIAERLAALLSSARHHVAVAVAVPVADSGAAALDGWIVVERTLTLESGVRAEISGLVVSACARRLGIGQALVACAERWCVAQGLAQISVRSNVERGESHPFYEHLGYVRNKTQHCYRKQLPPVI